MKIYDVENFPNPLRVRIALAEKNATSYVEFIPVDVMGGQEFIAGVNFTVADITLYAGLVFAGFVNVDVPIECTHLLAWKDRLESRPSIKA